MGSMTRLTAAALCALSLAALAAPPKRPSAIGSSKEDEPCPAIPATAGADVAYLRALQWAFEPAPAEIRAQAIEDLGLLGDARALNALAVLTLDAHPALAKAAIRAVAAIRHPRAEEILANLVRHPTAPLVTKQQALALVPFQNTPTALRFVHWFARQPSGNYELLAAARALSQVLPTPTLEAPALAPAPFPGDTK